MLILQNVHCWLLIIWLLVLRGSLCGQDVLFPQKQEQEITKELAAEEFEKNRVQAKQYLEKQKPSQAIPFLEKARSINSFDFANRYDLSEAYLKTGQLEKARTEAGLLFSIRNTADVHSLLGDIETAAHSPKDAVAQYQLAAQMDPSEGRIFDFGRSLMSFASDDAIHVFSHGVERYPESVQLRIGLGAALDIRGQSDRAAEILCEAADLDPSDQRPIDFLANLLSVSPEMFPQVDRRLKAYLRTHPSSAAANYDVAHNLLNQRSRELSSEDLAIGERLLAKAVRLDPKLIEAFVDLGRVLRTEGRLREAARAYEQAAKLQPNQEQTHYHLATVYRALGQAEKADQEIKIFKRLHSAGDAVESDNALKVERELPAPQNQRP